MTNKLFVGGLSYNTTSDGLKEYFATIGNVLSANVITDRETGRSRGFGFVEMATPEEAKMAMDKLNNTELDGRTVFVKEAHPKTDRPDNRGGDRGGDRIIKNIRNQKRW